MYLLSTDSPAQSLSTRESKMRKAVPSLKEFSLSSLLRGEGMSYKCVPQICYEISVYKMQATKLSG